MQFEQANANSTMLQDADGRISDYAKPYQSTTPSTVHTATSKISRGWPIVIERQHCSYCVPLLINYWPKAEFNAKGLVSVTSHVRTLRSSPFVYNHGFGPSLQRQPVLGHFNRNCTLNINTGYLQARYLHIHFIIIFFLHIRVLPMCGSSPEDIITHKLINIILLPPHLLISQFLMLGKLSGTRPHHSSHQWLEDLIQLRNANTRTRDIVQQSWRTDPQIPPMAPPCNTLMRTQPRDESVQQPSSLAVTFTSQQFRDLIDTTEHQHKCNIFIAHPMSRPPSHQPLESCSNRTTRTPQLPNQDLQNKTIHVEILQPERLIQSLEDVALGVGDTRSRTNIISDVPSLSKATEISLEDYATMFFQKVADGKDEGEQFLVYGCPGHLSFSLPFITPTTLALHIPIPVFNFDFISKNMVCQLPRQSHGRNMSSAHSE